MRVITTYRLKLVADNIGSTRDDADRGSPVQATARPGESCRTRQPHACRRALSETDRGATTRIRSGATQKTVQIGAITDAPCHGNITAAGMANISRERASWNAGRRVCHSVRGLRRPQTASMNRRWTRTASTPPDRASTIWSQETRQQLHQHPQRGQSHIHEMAASFGSSSEPAPVAREDAPSSSIVRQVVEILVSRCNDGRRRYGRRAPVLSTGAATDVTQLTVDEDGERRHRRIVERQRRRQRLTGSALESPLATRPTSASPCRGRTVPCRAGTGSPLAEAREPPRPPPTRTTEHDIVTRIDRRVLQALDERRRMSSPRGGTCWLRSRRAVTETAARAVLRATA